MDHDREMPGAGVVLEELSWPENDSNPIVFRNSYWRSNKSPIKGYHGFVMVWKHTEKIWYRYSVYHNTYTIALNHRSGKAQQYWRWIDALEAQAVFEYCLTQIEPPPPLYRTVWERLCFWKN